MPQRNDPCPCGSGRKYKKCCGAEAASDKKGAPAGRSPAVSGASTAPAGAPSPAAVVRAGQAPEAQAAGDAEKSFLITTGRGLDSERTEAERKKHLRRRIQTRDLRGSLVYNSGAFFRPPNPGSRSE